MSMSSSCSEACSMSSSNKKILADGKQKRQEKQRKWQAKQEEKLSKRPRPLETESSCRLLANEWVAQRGNAFYVTVEDLSGGIGAIAAPSLQSALKPYQDLQSTNSSTLFIAEGTETVRLLLQQVNAPRHSIENDSTGISIESIFCKSSVVFEPPVLLQKDVEQALEKQQFPVIIAENEQVQSLVAGFQISRGALACGVIPRNRNQKWLMNTYLPHFFLGSDSSCSGCKGRNSRRLRLLALDGICDTSNLGSMVRCASAFGIQAIILSRDCCDAWYRRAVRVSMGHVFRVPIVRIGEDGDLAQVLRDLETQFQVISYAAVLDRSDLILERMERGSVAHSWCCVIGNESSGISSTVAEVCKHCIRIEMQEGVDSLSAPIAAGILLHGLKEREGQFAGQ